METGTIMGNIDVAQVTLYAFWAFFAGLIFWIRREDRREGYPLESDVTGKQGDGGVIWIPDPKTFRLPHGGEVQVPDASRHDKRPIAAERTAPWPGAPLEPTGNPMLDAVGPASYAERADEPDRTIEGEVKIVPMRVAEDYSVETRDADPRGMKVIGADGAAGGTVTDVWVDRAEHVARYLEVEVGEGESARRVLLPINFTRVKGRRREVHVDAILGAHFADVPRTANPDQVTLREEDRICGYYGGGKLYATRKRTEPWL